MLSCLLLQLLTISIWAQTHYSHNYTINDGLPSNCINAIFKDSQGLIWIGTDAGLCLFDGKSFRVYNTSTGLASNNISSITEDTSGILWIGCMNGGLSSFDGQNFVRYTTKDGLISNAVRKVWYSRKFRILFVGTNEGCSVLDGKKFYSFSVKQTHALYDKLFITGYLEGRNYVNIYAFAIKNPILYYPKEKRFEIPDNLYSGRPSTSVSPIILENGDTIIGDERKGIFVSHGSQTRQYSEIGQVFSLTRDEFGNVWIAGWADENDKKDCYGGLYRYDGKNVERYGEKVGIVDRSVWTVFYDSSFHILWVGTLNQGLFKIPMPAFTYFDNSYFKLPSLSINDVLCHDNSMWIGAKGFLINLHPDVTFQSIDLAKYADYNKKEYSKMFKKTHSYLLEKDGSYEKYQTLIKNGQYNYPNPYNQTLEDLDYSKVQPPRSLYNPSRFQKDLQTELAQRSYLTPNVFHLGNDSKGNLYFSDKFGLKRLDKKKGYKEFVAIPNQESVQNFTFDNNDTLYHT